MDIGLFCVIIGPKYFWMGRGVLDTKVCGSGDLFELARSHVVCFDYLRGNDLPFADLLLLFLVL